MTLSKFNEDFAQVSQTISLMWRLSRPFGFADEAELEPEPILGGCGNAWHVAAIDLDTSD